MHNRSCIRMGMANMCVGVIQIEFQVCRYVTVVIYADKRHRELNEHVLQLLLNQSVHASIYAALLCDLSIFSFNVMQSCPSISVNFYSSDISLLLSTIKKYAACLGFLQLPCHPSYRCLISFVTEQYEGFKFLTKSFMWTGRHSKEPSGIS